MVAFKIICKDLTLCAIINACDTMNLNTFTLLNTLLAELKLKDTKDTKIYL